jgi:microsomal dipeptidase-like Zn-dependent dipeptidase
VDNPIGKSAAYDPTFTLANLYEEHALMHLSCAQPSDNIQWSYDAALQKLTYLLNSGVPGLSMPATTNCPNGVINAGDRDAQGNVIGLSAQGAVAIQHMMDRGMLIDVDHMSQASVSQTISLAKSRLPVNYPLFSGHNNLRGSAGPGSFKERQLTPQQYKDIGSLHGMAGIGAANTDAQAWLSTLSQTVSAMNVGNLPVIAFGTDADGMEFMMPPRAGSAVNPATPLPPPAIPLTLSHDGTRTWDYNHDGVAHYGLLPDFLLDVASLQSQGGPSVVVQMFNGAQSFYDTWYLAELDKKF